ncbi:17139_t:CDS:2 [Entrophospora sp. SA101]|nr:17139_t:CDS:2 [Entrophospora sp. SA101]
MSSSIISTWYSFTACCFPSPIIQLNRRVFKVIKLLGEGGFSFVYLVEDTSTRKLYALKKIRCPFGSENVKDAMKEVEMYKLFQHENIIKVVDTCIVKDKDGSRIVYIFLPYYKNGNLQDLINKNLTNGTNFSEKEILKLFRGICYAVQSNYNYNRNNNNYQQEDQLTDDILPFAHRDIKPGNILLSDDELPILMDFGSLVRARIKITTRSQALLQKELAEQHSTMPYRAPELFDVKTNTELNEKVDIWSLGCTLYAMAYGESPFETSINEGEGLKNLINQMLTVEPNDRPDIHKIIELVDTLLEQA